MKRRSTTCYERGCICNRLEFSDYCDSHSKKIERVLVNDSNIKGAGKGLFAFGKKGSVVFKKGELILDYEGEEYEEGKPLPLLRDYFLLRTDGVIVDSRVIGNLSRFVNDGRANTKNNCEFIDGYNVCSLVAKKNIKAGEEILCSYGDNYWIYK